jgi:hypothetical protein
MASVLSRDGKAMLVGYDVEETEEDLLDRREEAIEGVTVEALPLIAGAFTFTPLREARKHVESEL